MISRARESTTGERLADAALVVAGFVALQLLAALVAVNALDFPSGDVALLGGTAAGLAVECFAAACLVYWGDGRRFRLTQAVIEVELIVLLLFMVRAAISESSYVFDERQGYGLMFASAALLAVAGLVVMRRKPAEPERVSDA